MLSRRSFLGLLSGGLLAASMPRKKQDIWHVPEGWRACGIDYSGNGEIHVLSHGKWIVLHATCNHGYLSVSGLCRWSDGIEAINLSKSDPHRLWVNCGRKSEGKWFKLKEQPCE